MGSIPLLEIQLRRSQTTQGSRQIPRSGDTTQSQRIRSNFISTIGNDPLHTSSLANFAKARTSLLISMFHAAMRSFSSFLIARTSGRPSECMENSFHTCPNWPWPTMPECSHRLAIFCRRLLTRSRTNNVCNVWVDETAASILKWSRRSSVDMVGRPARSGRLWRASTQGAVHLMPPVIRCNEQFPIPKQGAWIRLAGDRSGTLLDCGGRAGRSERDAPVAWQRRRLVPSLHLSLSQPTSDRMCPCSTSTSSPQCRG
jgi:hypothetical protein